MTTNFYKDVLTHLEKLSYETYLCNRSSVFSFYWDLIEGAQDSIRADAKAFLNITKNQKVTIGKVNLFHRKRESKRQRIMIRIEFVEWAAKEENAKYLTKFDRYPNWQTTNN